MISRMLFILPPDTSDFELIGCKSWDISRIPPIGALTIMSYLHEKKHAVELVDCRELIVEYGTRDYIPIVLDRIRTFRPDVVGFNILTAVVPEAMRISDAVREEFPDVYQLAGGTHPAVEPELTLQQMEGLDAICVGPGEEVCLDVVEGNRPQGIQGLFVRGAEEHFSPRPVEMNIDKYPFPNYSLVNAEHYTVRNWKTTFYWLTKSLSAITSRSCPYSCKFCASDWSKPFRYHSAEYVVELVKYLASFDIDTISFWDDTLAFSKERMHDICTGLIKSELFQPRGRLKWRGSSRANQIDKELLSHMRAAGCFHVSMGIETGSNRMLEVINKKSTVDVNRRACAMVQESNIDLGASFMVGIPSETADDMEKTLQFIKDIDCNATGGGCFRPLPGSPFYQSFVESGMMDKNCIDWSNLGNFSTLSDQIFCDTDKETYQKYAHKMLKLVYGNKWGVVHEQDLPYCLEVVEEMTTNLTMKVCVGQDYDASRHIDLDSFLADMDKGCVHDEAVTELLEDVEPAKVRRQPSEGNLP